MNWFTFSVQWLHVLLGILWFGYSLALAVFVIPALNRLPITTQREVGAALASVRSRSSTWWPPPS